AAANWYARSARETPAASRPARPAFLVLLRHQGAKLCRESANGWQAAWPKVLPKSIHVGAMRSDRAPGLPDAETRLRPSQKQPDQREAAVRRSPRDRPLFLVASAFRLACAEQQAGPVPCGRCRDAARD